MVFSKMETNRERGNALIYVLIAIALFAALSMTLGRQTDTGEAANLSDERAELYATQLIAYAAQAKSSLDQMMFSGGDIATLDFTLPGAAGYDTGAALDKIKRVYHPDGGGLVAEKLPEEAASYTGSDPVAGWYMGRFNNVEWTKTGGGNGTDVILVAYGINKKICERINEKVKGSPAIPQMTATIRNVLIDDEFHTGVNADLTTVTPGAPVCAACDKVSSLCVEDSAGNIFGFYTVLLDR
ncbi:MAG: hypothetical protein DYH13_02840 [Alphaproteobacteria bacterium PRO2]|nr:hypothetical protein [Alphaproteobacteria bacterium PRO2]